MKWVCALAATAVVVCCSASAPPAKSGTTLGRAEKARIARLIERLGEPGYWADGGDVVFYYTDSDRAGMDLVKYGPKAVPPLIAVLGDKNEWRRRWAARLLGEIGDKRAVGPLIKALRVKRDSHGDELEALGSLHDPAAIPAIEPFLDREGFIEYLGMSDRVGDGYWAGRALGLIGKPARRLLLQVVSSPVAHRRENALIGLSELADPQDLALAYRMQKDPDEHVRRAADGLQNSIEYHEWERTNGKGGR